MPTMFYCSFCGKSQHEVAKLIAGPSMVLICNECVDLCSDIVHRRNTPPRAEGDAEARRRHNAELDEIRRHLAAAGQALRTVESRLAALRHIETAPENSGGSAEIIGFGTTAAETPRLPTSPAEAAERLLDLRRRAALPPTSCWR